VVPVAHLVYIMAQLVVVVADPAALTARTALAFKALSLAELTVVVVPVAGALALGVLEQ
jgi:hypothetical protein